MTPQQIKAMKLALEALEKCRTYHQQDWSSEETTKPEVKQAITAIKEALAQPKQEPVAWMDADGNVSDNNDHNCFPLPLYTTPPQRKPLTDEEFDKLLGPFPRYAEEWSMTDFIRFARAIEAAHGIKEST